MFDSGLILKGEIRCKSLSGIKGLRQLWDEKYSLAFLNWFKRYVLYLATLMPKVTKSDNYNIPIKQQKWWSSPYASSATDLKCWELGENQTDGQNMKCFDVNRY